MTLGDNTREGRTEKTVLRIQRVYLALAILVVLGVLSSMLGQSSLREMLEAFVFVLVYGSVYFGLLRRREWVTPLVLITSAFSCFWHLIGILHPAEDIKMLLSKIFGGLLLLFFAYQIAFFCKPEVRSFFGARGRVLF